MSDELVLILYEKMREKKDKKLLRHVQETYNLIADEFSDTRQIAWDEFDFFTAYLKPGIEIVDLGCGNGRLLNFLAKKTAGWNQTDFHYLGIDNSEKLLEKALQLHPGQTFIMGDQLQIPVAEEKVDLLFNIAAFHHIPGRTFRLAALGEMKRVLKKNGFLIMTVWNLWQKKYWKEIVKALLKSMASLGYYRFNDFFIPWGKRDTVMAVRQSENQYGIPKVAIRPLQCPVPRKIRYYHAFVPGELEKLLKDGGFEIVEFFKSKHNICVIARPL